jgi:SAM-dependent methyltransferase
MRGPYEIAVRLREYFESTTDDWEAIYRSPTLYARLYRERLDGALGCVDQLQLVGSAVDIGCGPGLGTCGLLERGFRVLAVDASARMVERTLARARARGLHSAVRGARCDIQHLGLSDGAFDLAFVVGVSEWMPALERPLAEIARVLRVGGALTLTADNSWALARLLDPLLHPLGVPTKRGLGRALRLVWPSRRPLRVYPRSRAQLESALRRAGLTVTVARTLGYGPFTLFNQRLVPDSLGHALHERLASLAARGVPWLDCAGLSHVLVARKLTPPSAPG